MVKTTRKQRLALWSRWDMIAPRISYREFRKTVQPTFCMDNAVVVHWCGMWLCIERDGYCHS